MFQYFNTDTLMSKFIKNLISTNYIPTAKIWKQGRPLVKDYVYITKTHIVRANRNATASETEDIDVFNETYFTIVSTFTEGLFYRGLTTKYFSNISTYDSDTHYYLGQYLRALRDLHDVDLMPYYNCWDGTINESLRIVRNAATTRYTMQEDVSKEDSRIVALIPIKYNQEYSIYINSTQEIKMAVMYWDGSKTLNNLHGLFSTENIEKVTTKVTTDANKEVHPYTLNYFNPIKMNAITISASDVDRTKKVMLEEYLTLAIEVENSALSSLVVLEGDYINNRLLFDDVYTKNGNTYTLTGNKLKNARKYYGIPYDDLTNIEFNSTFMSPSRFFNSIIDKPMAFSDRVVEYLTENAITPNDTISDNIARTQEYAHSEKCYKQNGLRLDTENVFNGLYGRELRNFVYDIAQSNKKNAVLFEINGYVDKDSEEVILRGKE